MFPSINKLIIGMFFPYKIKNMPADFGFLVKKQRAFSKFLSLSVREQNADFDAAVFERIKCGQSCNAIRFNKSTLGAAPLGRPQKGIAQLGVRPVYK